MRKFAQLCERMGMCVCVCVCVYYLVGQEEIGDQ